MPAGAFFLRAQFEGDATENQGDEHQEERQIKGAEHGGIYMRKGGKEGTTGRNHPDFIAIPYRADGAQDERAVFLALAHKGGQHTYAVVKAFQKEEARKEYGD